MAQPSPGESPGSRRRSNGSVRESLFYPVLERNEQERLEALVRRRAGGAERREGVEGEEAQLGNRPKRWTWGGPPDGADGKPKTLPCNAIGPALSNELPAASSANQSQNVLDILGPPTSEQPMNKRLSNSSAAIHSPERVSGVSHRLLSPGNQTTFRSSSNRRSVAGLPEENTGEKTPTMESPTTTFRSNSFRAHSKAPSTPKRAHSTKSQTRAQSPCSPGQYPPSPLRHRATTPDDRGHWEVKGQGTLERKSSKTNDTSEKKIPKSTSRELNAESPATPTGKSVAGTTDAEAASKLLAERRRLARIQKEQEERQRHEEERLREQEELRRQQEALERQERAVREAEEEQARREEERRSREEEERRQKERRWKDMEEQLDREREEAFLRAQREAERKRQERELLHIREEQARQQRKKRIDEIMKRTRKSEVDLPSPVPVYEERGQADGVVEEDTPVPAGAPVITLGPLDSKSCVDELSDGVQSMDVSPVSREEQASTQDFSTVTQGLGHVSNACTLEHLLDLAIQGRGHGGDTPPYAKLQAGSAAALGDLNKNLLIHAYSGASQSSALVHSLSPEKLDVQ